MFSKILVPLDGSKLAERALQLAAQLAETASGELLLLRVPEQAAGSRDAAAYLAQLPEHRLPLTIQTRVVHGDVASVIVDTAVSEQVDLIVMAANGRSSFGRAILGSIAERVLRAAPCPMLLSRQERPIRHLLIPLDGSHLAERALPLGRATAHHLGSTVTLVRVEETIKVAPTIAAQWLARDEGKAEAIATRLNTDAATYLAQVAAQEGKVETAVLTGPVVSSLIHYIENEPIDLIVMATHGFAGLGRWDYGHVTEKIMRGVDTSLLIIRPPAHELI